MEWQVCVSDSYFTQPFVRNLLLGKCNYLLLIRVKWIHEKRLCHISLWELEELDYSNFSQVYVSHSCPFLMGEGMTSSDEM